MNPINSPVYIAEFPHGGATAHLISAHTSEPSLEKVLETVSEEVAQRHAQIAFQYLFGGRQFFPRAVSALEKSSWPLTLLHGDPCSGETLSATQCVALSGVELHPILDGGRVVGNWYETTDARYALLGDLRADDLSASRAEQARAVFEKMERLLEGVGMAFTDTVRTWLYLRDLLDWYDEFNAVRTRFFQERGVFEKRVPASTGIGAGTAAGEAMVGALLAVQPKNQKVQIHPVASPLQCPALDYKSSFARAMEVECPESRFLTISGTASIAPDGATAHVGDCEKQIDLTMRVIQEILRSREMEWNDTVRAIAYFKDISDAPLLEAYCAQHGIALQPFVYSHADVCRDDLLFEVELDAVKRV